MTSQNAASVVKKWRNITKSQLKLYNQAPALAQENEALRKALLEAKGIDITLSKDELRKVQHFKMTTTT